MSKLNDLRRTKIVCIMGPSCAGEALPKLIEAGMNVARLNFSHGTHEEHGDWIRRLRSEAESRGLPLAILQDLAGPKIRIGDRGRRQGASGGRTGGGTERRRRGRGDCGARQLPGNRH